MFLSDELYEIGAACDKSDYKAQVIAAQEIYQRIDEKLDKAVGLGQRHQLHKLGKQICSKLAAEGYVYFQQLVREVDQEVKKDMQEIVKEERAKAQVKRKNGETQSLTDAEKLKLGIYK